MIRFYLVAVLSLSAAGCTAAAGGAAPCGQLAPRNDHEVVLCNDLGEAVLATVAWPEGPPPSTGWPAVLLLHGSGGLHLDGDGDSCSEELEQQYQRWAELLTDRGYAVMMPDSFLSRGFCEWNERPDEDELDKHERLVLRTFDAAAAARYMCADPRVDCSRLAAMGFSNGASTVLMLLREDHRVCQDERLRALSGLPRFVGGVAYYPGCALDGELVTSLDRDYLSSFYYPRAPLWVPHAGKDQLLDACEAFAEPQTEVIAEHRNMDQDMFELRVYDDARHGFDHYQGDRDDDREAREDAEARTLDKLDEWF